MKVTIDRDWSTLTNQDRGSYAGLYNDEHARIATLRLDHEAKRKLLDEVYGRRINEDNTEDLIVNLTFGRDDGNPIDPVININFEESRSYYVEGISCWFYGNIIDMIVNLKFLTLKGIGNAFEV